MEMEWFLAVMLSGAAFSGIVSGDPVASCKADRLERPIMVRDRDGGLTPLSVNTASAWCISSPEGIDNPLWATDGPESRVTTGSEPSDGGEGPDNGE